MKLRTKILLTVVLAIIFWCLFGCGSQEHFVAVPSPANGVTDAMYLQQVYVVYNEEYFHNKLTKTPTIDLLEPKDFNMASTLCEGDNNGVGYDCIIHFNEKYTAAPRVADFTLLHEMCHIKTWMKDMDDNGKQVDHGRNWRGCMVQLDMEGAFRQILIDNYKEEMK